MTTLTPDCIKAIDETLAGIDWYSDRAVTCIKQLGRQPRLDHDDIELLKRILATGAPHKAGPQNNEWRQYANVEAAALVVLEQFVGSDVSPFVVSALNRVPFDSFYLSWDTSLPNNLLAIFSIAEKYCISAPSIPIAVNSFLGSLLPFLTGVDLLRMGHNDQWKVVVISACRVLGRSKLPDAAPTLSAMLSYVDLDTDLLVAAVQALGEIGTDAAANAVGSVFPNREQSLGDGLGYRDSRHDALCRAATEAMISIGTRHAFDVFVQRIDEANRKPIDTVWHSDVKAAMNNAMPEAPLRNLIAALREDSLAEPTRAQLLSYLHRDA